MESVPIGGDAPRTCPITWSCPAARTTVHKRHAVTLIGGFIMREDVVEHSPFNIEPSASRRWVVPWPKPGRRGASGESLGCALSRQLARALRAEVLFVRPRSSGRTESGDGAAAY